MAYTLAGLDLRRAEGNVPRYGIPVASAWLTDEAALVAGARASLVVGDLTMKGTLRRGGTFAGSTEWILDGGAGGWSKNVAARHHRSDGGIMLSQVAADLAAEVGEQVVLEPGVDRSLGYAWTRIAGLASEALDALGVPWWVEVDGVTHLGTRPVLPVPSTVAFQVADYSPRFRRAQLVSPGDTFAAFLPGATWSAPGIDPFTVTSFRLSVDRSSASLDVLEVLEASELFERLVARSARYYGRFAYRVADIAGGRPSLQAVDAAPGLPDQLYLDQVHGLPGASSTLAPGNVVLVGFRGGSPAAPYVTGYVSGTPAQVLLDAATLIRLGGSGAQFAARADLVATELGKIVTSIDSLILAAGGGTAYVPGSVAATKVKVE
jgi:hypothetical protein